MRFRILIGLISLVVLLAAVAVPSVQAHNGVNHTTETEAQEQEDTPRSRLHSRLTDAQKRICENRAEAIAGIMQRSTARAKAYGQFFTTATERVTMFVEKQGQTTDPQLLAALQNAQHAFETDFKTMQDKAVLDCNSDAPKNQLQAFQGAHRQVTQDLKAWRTALKNLIQSYKTEGADA